MVNDVISYACIGLSFVFSYVGTNLQDIIKIIC